MDPMDELLTEAEREALKLDTSDTDGKPAEVVRADAAPAPAAAAPAEPPKEAPKEPAAEAPKAEEPGAAAAVEGVPAEATAVSPAPAEPAEPREQREFVPQFTVPEVPEDAAAKLADLDAKLDSGEITLAQYNQQRDEMRFAEFQAKFAKEQNEAIGRQRWAWEVESFFDQNEQYRKSTLLNAAFDRAVRDLGAAPENADKPMKWFLKEAHKQVQALIAPQANPNTPPPPKTPDVKPRVPTTLAVVPQAGRGDAAESEFSHLDGLVGEELEIEVAKLTAAQKQRYLAA